jgi:hypothetical protein
LVSIFFRFLNIKVLYPFFFHLVSNFFPFSEYQSVIRLPVFRPNSIYIFRPSAVLQSVWLIFFSVPPSSFSLSIYRLPFSCSSLYFLFRPLGLAFFCHYFLLVLQISSVFFSLISTHPRTEGLSPGRGSRASVTCANTTLAPPLSRVLAGKSRAANGLLAHAHACAGNT